MLETDDTAAGGSGASDVGITGSFDNRDIAPALTEAIAAVIRNIRASPTTARVAINNAGTCA